MSLTASIIIPYYNAPACLRHLMPTLPDQTYPHHLVEVGAADDGSAEAAENEFPPVLARNALPPLLLNRREKFGPCNRKSLFP